MVMYFRELSKRMPPFPRNIREYVQQTNFDFDTWATQMVRYSEESNNLATRIAREELGVVEATFFPLSITFHTQPQERAHFQNNKSLKIKTFDQVRLDSLRETLKQPTYKLEVVPEDPNSNKEDIRNIRLPISEIQDKLRIYIKVDEIPEYEVICGTLKDLEKRKMVKKSPKGTYHCYTPLENVTLSYKGEVRRFLGLGSLAVYEAKRRVKSEPVYFQIISVYADGKVGIKMKELLEFTGVDETAHALDAIVEILFGLNPKFS